MVMVQKQPIIELAVLLQQESSALKKSVSTLQQETLRQCCQLLFSLAESTAPSAPVSLHDTHPSGAPDVAVLMICKSAAGV